MDRHGETDGQALLRIVVRLLWLAALAEAAAMQPAGRRLAVLAVLRHAAAVASAYATRVHAPVRPYPSPSGSDESETAQLAAIFRALACALAYPARQALRAAALAALRTRNRHDDSPAALSGFVIPPTAADTS